MTFWGSPTYRPETPEIMRAMGQFHERSKKNGRDMAVRVAHVTLRAAALFISSVSPRDAMAALDEVRQIVETQKVT